MGMCCQSLQDDGKVEGMVEAYEERFGITLCDFAYASRQLDLYSLQRVIETVRIPILTHSLGLRVKGRLVPGAQRIYDFLHQGTGWSQKRMATLCALCCEGSGEAKSVYLAKMYCAKSGVLNRVGAEELVADATIIALSLLPRGAEDLYVEEEWDDDTITRVRQYANQLERALEKVREGLVASMPWCEQGNVDLKVLAQRMTSGTLKALCCSTLLRRLARVTKHEGY